MGNGVRTARVYQFGAFTVDARTGELSHAGRRTPLRDQSVQLLLALLEQPGELLTREELAGRLWAAGTFVDFDRGLNKAINHLREALGDSAEQPRFIETLPRKGYRFIAPVTSTGEDVETASLPVTAPESSRRRWLRLPVVLIAGISLTIGAGIGVRNWVASRSSRPRIAALAVTPAGKPVGRRRTTVLCGRPHRRADHRSGQDGQHPDHLADVGDAGTVGPGRASRRSDGS